MNEKTAALEQAVALARQLPSVEKIRLIEWLAPEIKRDLVDLAPPEENTAWEALAQLVEECAVETGITDLAHQHDHYLYGKSKRG